MAEVDISVNRRTYRVACDNGQENHLKKLAVHLDTHVASLSNDLGQIGEARLMMLAALTVCDELFDTREKLAAADTAEQKLDPDTIGGASRVIEAAAERIESIAAKVA